jgi:TorA maturation chaperone TorD
MSDPIPQSSALDEETARAEVYGLLARLYYAPPDADLLAKLRVAVTEAPAPGSYLEEPWRAFIGAARAMQDEEIAAEFEALFGGVGKPDVLPYASSHLSGFLNERPLAQLRDDLRELGLDRDEAMAETEDHVAYLFEVMRYLIAGDDVAVSNLTRQSAFFARHLQPWIDALCDEIAAHPRARFYGALATFTQAFTSVEQQGFDLLA